MKDKRKLNSEGFMPIYKEISDIIGPEATYALYKSMRGQQLTLPKKLYTKEFILKEIQIRANNVDIHQLALEYDYTERYLRQLLKQYNQKDKGGK